MVTICLQEQRLLFLTCPKTGNSGLSSFLTNLICLFFLFKNTDVCLYPLFTIYKSLTREAEVRLCCWMGCYLSNAPCHKRNKNNKKNPTKFFFPTQNFLTLKIFRPQILLFEQKIFWTQNFFRLKIFFLPKFFLDTKGFR